MALLPAQLSYSQVTIPDDLTNTGKLKTNVVGSYPTEIWEYNWIVEYWSPYQKQYISYTSFGEPSEILVVGLGGETRSLFTYGSNQMLTEKVEQKKVGGNWVNDRRTTNAYDDNLMETSTIVESWNGSEWVIQTGNIFDYDTSLEGVMVMTVTMWSREDGIWINSARITYSYGSEMLVSEAVTEIWENGGWVNSSKTRFVYEDNKVKEMYMSAWDDDSWMESTKMVYEYSGNDSQIMTLYTGLAGNWIPSQRFTDNYDDHGNTILTTIEIFITDWVILSGSEYTLTYEGDNLVERITKTYSMSEPSEPPLKTGGTWKNVYKEEFKSFASLSTNPIDLESSRVIVFPNPAHGQVSLKFENINDKNLELSVIDLSGRSYLKKDVYIPSSHMIYDLKFDELPAGTFIILTRNREGKVISSSKFLNKK
jgi:hypothetical protein